MAKKKSARSTSKALSRKESNEARKALFARRDELLSGAKQEYSSVHTRDKGLMGDSFDIAQEVADESVSRGILATAEEELAQIDAALERIDNGEYGLCSVCGKPIPKPRLKVLPYATMCVKCKSELEGNGSGGRVENFIVGIMDGLDDDEAEDE
ncbi:MAG: TraR/DksA family transcriptional regulator [Planctomycetes bacterium]|nr:TraR/DksA family transcriptional regulator [Planctomycetota bacterium]